MSDNNNPNFFGIIPAPVLFHPELKDFSVRLFAVISSLCNNKGYCTATNATLGKWLGASTSKVSRAIAELAEYNLVTVDVEKNGSGTWRKVYLCISRTEGVKHNQQGGTADLPNGLSRNDKRGIADLPNQKNKTSNNKININKEGSVSVPLTKEQLRNKQFEDNIKQVEFPASVEALPKLKEWVIHYMKETNKRSPLKYYSPNHLKRTTKQVYTILVEQKKTPKYLVKLIKESVSREWRTLNSEWVHDDTVNKTLPTFGKYSAH